MQYNANRRVERDKLPLQVVRGYSPTEPNKLSVLLPSIDDEAIKEGMLVVRKTGTIGGVTSQIGFKKSAAADSQTYTSVYIALHDQDSHDVQEAGGKLVGLDCSDDYEVQTGYFDADGTAFAVDDPLTVGADGVVVLADAPGDVIIGRISAIGEGSVGEFAYNGKTPSTSVANATFIQFKTCQSGAVIPAS